MGIVVAFVFLIGGVLTLISLLCCIIYANKASKQDNQPYGRYVTKYFLIALVLGIVACWLLNLIPSKGAPTGDVYLRWILGAFLASGTPTLGFLAATWKISTLRKKP